eukprot:CAMPEP_0195082450 /NCGR_PEP_ID=MMETSP0448-20130528/23631_1 /TAXON_ID=66468 /ORGANISM="Heterocapsa triquestra, Strain CCMP 448" /LENGTH=529 /DNA_ID=CAMNT_0040115561 /DNA_START=70 /DNA_END=1655 /DNA_ORIENTATION=-
MMELLGRAFLVLLASMCAAEATSSPTHRLSGWLGQLTIPVPAGASLELPLFGLSVEWGECRNLTIGSVSPINNSSGTELELGIELHGLSVTCDIQAYSEGNLTVNVTIVDSSFKLAAQIHPQVPFMTPDLPLPLGGMNMTTCAVDVHIGSAAFDGDSPVVEITGMLDISMINMLIGNVLQDPICQQLRDLIEVNGTEAMGVGAALVSTMLLPAWPLEEPTAVVAPTQNWTAWAPTMVIQQLVDARLPVWGKKLAGVLDAAVGMRLLTTDFGLSIDLDTIQVSGVDPFEVPDIALLANGSNVGVEANLAHLRFMANFKVGAHLKDQPAFEKHLEIGVGLDELRMGGRLLVDQPMMKEFMDNGEFSQFACLVDVAESATDPPADSMAMTKMEMTLQPSTRIEVTQAPLDSLEQNATNFVNTILGALQAGYMPSIRALINGGLGIARGPLNVAMWKYFEDLVPCGAFREGVDDSVLTGLWGTALTTVCLGAVGAFIAPYVRSRRAPIKAEADAAGALRLPLPARLPGPDVPL